MERRTFIKGMLGTGLGVVTAPAIVRASSLMKLAIPKRILRGDKGRGFPKGLAYIDELVYQDSEKWQIVEEIIDGELVIARMRRPTVTIERIDKTISPEEHIKLFLEEPMNVSMQTQEFDLQKKIKKMQKGMFSDSKIV